MAGGSGIANPTHLELVAAVAEVAGHGHHILPLVGGDGAGAAGLAVAEEDVLDAVEAQQGVAQTLASHHVAFLTVEGVNHGGTVHQRVEGILVEGPAVDVRVDAEVASGTEEEGFALLPCLAGGEEGLASLTHAGISGVGFEGRQLGGQQLGFGGQGAVGGSHRVVHKLFGYGGSLAVVAAGVVVIVFAARGKRQGGNQGHR